MDRGRRGSDQERTRDRRVRDRQEKSPVRSPARSPLRSRRDRSLSPRDLRQRRHRSRSPSRISPRYERSSKHDHRRQRSPSRTPPRHQRGSRHSQHSPSRTSPRPQRGSKHGQQSPSRTSPRPPRSSKHDQRTGTGVANARDEDVDNARRERSRGEDSPQQNDAVSRVKEVQAALEATEINKEKPSFEYSGKLAAETNKVKGVILQFTEPPEARKPSTRWRLYVFKDGEPLNDPLYIHRQTCYLFGRERRVADIPTDHPSCSKQHAVIQYRLTDKDDGDGSTSSQVRPYVMDLGSTNGTMLNGERLDPQRYYEMFEKDTIKFGNSSREYVLLHEHSIG